MPPKLSSVRNIAGQNSKGSVGSGKAVAPTAPAKQSPKGLKRPGQG
jgi:hypothetical protein